MNIPKHKRFTYFNAGSNTVNVAVVTEDHMGHYIQTTLSDDEKEGCRSAEEMFEKTFRAASKFGCWLDKEWRTE